MIHWTIERATEIGKIYKEFFVGEIRVGDGGTIIFRDDAGNITRLLRDWSDIHHTTFEEMHYKTVEEEGTRKNAKHWAALSGIDHPLNKQLHRASIWALVDGLKKKAGGLNKVKSWLAKRAEEEGVSDFYSQVIDSFTGETIYDFIKHISNMEGDIPLEIFELWKD